jgi:hypothetical protein
MKTQITFLSLLASATFLMSTGADAQAKTCQTGAPLPISGLCEAEAQSLMPPLNADYADGLKLMNCKPVLQETLAVGRPLLYYGADCGDGPVRLSASMGAHSGSLSKTGGGMDFGMPGAVELVTFLPSDPQAPTASLVKWTRDAMAAEGVFSAQEIAKCDARKISDTPDLWTVDEFTAQALPPYGDYPRIACGRYGYTEESNARWRVAHGYAWFADFGQDAYVDFDFTSFTLLPQTQPQNPKIPEPKGPTPIAGLDEGVYGATKGWTVYTGETEVAQAYCAAERDFDDVKLRLGWDGAQWQLAVQGTLPPDYLGRLEVDGTFWDLRGTSEKGWVFAWLGAAELSAIRDGNLMILDLGRASLDFPLVGTAASILKVQECVAQRD